MKRTSKLFLTLAMSAAMAFGVVGFTACTSGENGKSAYEIAVDNGFEGTEQEWLESLKGQSPKAPEIEIGENGNWFIDGVDTGIKAKGEDGKDGKDGENGTNGANGANGTNGTNGENGADGKDGARGSLWFTGEGDPDNADGLNNDMYLDTLTGNIWQKTNNMWELKMCIKGAGEVDDGSVDLGTHNLEALHSVVVDIDLEPGYYYVSAEVLEGAINSSGLRAQVVGHDNVYNMYDAHYSEYSCVLKIAEGDTQIQFSTSATAVNVKLTLREWNSPVVKADGTEYVVPLIYDVSVSGELVPVNYDDSLKGKTVKVIFDNLPSGILQVPVYKSNGVAVGNIMPIVPTMTTLQLPEDDNAIAFACVNKNECYNITLRLELV